MILYWNETILPRMKSGERVIIAAHGNSLRALVKYLDNMSEEILELNIPTGVPLVYEFDENFKPLKRYYLGNADEIAAKAAAVANGGKAKVNVIRLKSRSRLQNESAFLFVANGAHCLMRRCAFYQAYGD